MKLNGKSFVLFTLLLAGLTTSAYAQPKEPERILSTTPVHAEGIMMMISTHCLEGKIISEFTGKQHLPAPDGYLTIFVSASEFIMFKDGYIIQYYYADENGNGKHIMSLDPPSAHTMDTTKMSIYDKKLHINMFHRKTDYRLESIGNKKVSVLFDNKMKEYSISVLQ